MHNDHDRGTAAGPGGAAPAGARQVPVWDIAVRLAHWALVVGFVIAYLTEGEDEVLTIHVWAGYAVAAIVLWRVLWGFVGPANARFASFVRGPRAVLGYLGGLVRGGGARYLGHNPAGGAMVLLLLASLAVTTASGMALYAIEEGAGPLAGLLGRTGDASVLGRGNEIAPGSRDATAAEEDENDDVHGASRTSGAVPDEVEDEWLEEVHELFANLSLFLVLLHIAGVVASSVAHGENLPRAMVTGRKRA